MRYYQDQEPSYWLCADVQARKPSRWLTRATRTKEREGEELRLYNDGANDGVNTTGPQGLRSGLLTLDLATAKDLICYTLTPSEGVLDKEGPFTVESTVAFAEYFSLDSLG